MDDLVRAIRAGDDVAAKRIARRRGAFHPRPVLEAARFARAEILDALIDLGADPNALWKRYRPLHAAIQAEAHAEPTAAPDARIACVDVLLARGADPELEGSWFAVRPLLLAAFSGERAIVDRLLAAGAREDAFTDAALGRRARIAKALRADPAIARARDASTFTALACAAASRMGRDRAPTARALLAIAEALLDAGADPNACVREGNHDLDVSYFAIGSGQRALLELLFDRGADPDRALGHSFFRDDRAWAELALERGGRIERARHDGRPVLLELIRWGRFEEALWLLGRGADPNVRDASGWTALHQAASRGSRRMVEAALAAGADPRARDRDGKTALDLARARGRRDVVAVLEPAGAPAPRAKPAARTPRAKSAERKPRAKRATRKAAASRR